MTNKFVVNAESDSSDAESADTTTKTWRQKLAGIHGYILTCIAMQISFGIYFSCFFAVLGPLSKQFHFTDSKIGFINTADDIGRIPFLLITAYFGSRFHIPRLLGLSGCIYSIIAVSITIPYFIFKHGAGGDELVSRSVSNSSNMTSLILCNSSDITTQTKAISDMEFGDNVAYYVFIVSYVLLGITGSPWSSLYFWYIDENADRAEFPLMLGILYSAGMVGPIIGTYLAAAVNSVYVDLSDTDLTPKDPTFIGAWWLGLLVASSLCLISCPFLCCFPRTMKTDEEIKAYLDEASKKDLMRKLSRKYSTAPTIEGGLPMYHMTDHQVSLVSKSEGIPDSSGDYESYDDVTGTVDIPIQVTIEEVVETAVERKQRYKNLMNDIYRPRNAPRLVMNLLTNPVYMLWALITAAWRYEYGNQVFIVKFFAMQFDLPAWEASTILGVKETIASVCAAVGIFFGGYAVYKIRPTYCQAVMMCAAFYLAMSCIAIGQMFIGCDNFELYGHDGKDATLELPTPCNINCSCNTFAYKPVCDEGITYFSPCHAGCTDIITNGSTEVFVDCACTASGSATKGACPKTCSSYYIYVTLEVVKMVLDGTTWSPLVLLILRCVDSTEKALALGLRSFLAYILGIPVAMVYGAVLDSACLVWQNTFRSDDGDSRGVCWVYDFPAYRQRFWGIPAGFRLFEVVIEVIMIALTYNKAIQMYDDDVDVPPDKDDVTSDADDVSERKAGDGESENGECDRDVSENPGGIDEDDRKS